MIALDQITFAYPGAAPLFQDFSWRVERGEAWAVMGTSGCGKSTLLYLLAGLRLVQSGQVRIDGAPAGEYELEYWHPRWAGGTNELARQPLRLRGEDRHTLVIGARP